MDNSPAFSRIKNSFMEEPNEGDPVSFARDKKAIMRGSAAFIDGARHNKKREYKHYKNVKKMLKISRRFKDSLFSGWDRYIKRR